jgi:hypothetical protein
MPYLQVLDWVGEYLCGKHASLLDLQNWNVLYVRPRLPKLLNTFSINEWRTIAQRHNTQHNDTQHNGIQHTDIQHKGLLLTLSINDTQHYSNLPLCCVVMLSVVFCLLLCWMSVCWVSVCWVSVCWVSVYWVSVWWVSICWVSLCRVKCFVFCYPECQYAWCRYAECCGADSSVGTTTSVSGPLL